MEKVKSLSYKNSFKINFKSISQVKLHLLGILKGKISPENQELLKEIGPIDFHSHIGNILERKPEQVFDIDKKFPIDIRTIGATFGKYKYPNAFMKKILASRPIDNIIRQSGKTRNNSANLKTFNESIKESFVSKAVCLPIPPYQTFEDLMRVQEINDNIIIFTGIDFSLFYKSSKKYDDILCEIERKLKQDIKKGAKGLKIHPIIQGISPSAKIVGDVVEIWTKISYGLPIIFHTGITEYCKKDENCNGHKPEYGQIKYFEKLAQNYPDSNIVLGHAGLFQVDEVIERMSKYYNVSVDTSFQGVEKILSLVKVFGIERVYFASDWPYGDRIPAMNIILEALEKVKSASYSSLEIKEMILKNNALRVMQMV